MAAVDYAKVINNVQTADAKCHLTTVVLLQRSARVELTFSKAAVDKEAFLFSQFVVVRDELLMEQVGDAG
jgi:hypothetical protein